MNLFELGQHSFNKFLAEFANYGIRANDNLALCKGDGMLCYYDLHDGHIYLSLPDLESPIGKLQLLFLRSLLGCEDNEEVLYFFRLMLPRVIAHEIAHHFRHRYGLFGDNLWHEEQVANQLATAVTKQRFSPAEKEKARLFLERAIAGLEEKLEVKDMAADSYHSIWEALSVSNKIGEVALGYMQLAHELFAIKPADILESDGQLSVEFNERLERRDGIISEINKEYASNFMRYLYYQLSWLYLDLTSHENQYVETFARQHLNISIPMLPLLPQEIAMPTEDAIMAMFKAYQDCKSYSEAAAHYFYKRYRVLLLTRLQSAELAMPGQAERLRKESAFLLQNWGGQEKEPDMLNYLAQLAPPSLRRLFPHQIIDQVPLHIPIQLHLPTETDKRLWRHVVLQENDQGAENTLSRLTILDKIEIYHPLPAEVMLELANNFCRVKLAVDEPIIWQSEINNDVYILITGNLEVVVNESNREILIGKIGPGEVFGEMAFFTREPRKATVRAIEPSECFVLKDSDLYMFAFKYPSVLMQMARILTRRLNQMNENIHAQSNL